MKRIKRILTYPLIAVAAIVMLFEEWLWHRLIDFGDRLARLPVVARAEAWVSSLPPYGAMAFFLIPAFSLLPIKIAALYLLAHGHGFLGVTFIVFAKVFGTAWAARIYHLTSAQLLKIRWFATFHTGFLAKKAALLDWLRAQRAWIAVHGLVREIKTIFKSQRPGFGRRWTAARRRIRARCCLLPH